MTLFQKNMFISFLMSLVLVKIYIQIIHNVNLKTQQKHVKDKFKPINVKNFVHLIKLMILHQIKQYF